MADNTPRNYVNDYHSFSWILRLLAAAVFFLALLHVALGGVDMVLLGLFLLCLGLV